MMSTMHDRIRKISNIIFYRHLNKIVAKIQDVNSMSKKIFTKLFNIFNVCVYIYMGNSTSHKSDKIDLS